MRQIDKMLFMCRLNRMADIAISVHDPELSRMGVMHGKCTQVGGNK